MFDRKAYMREYMRKWRLANLAKARENGRRAQSRWKHNHPAERAEQRRRYKRSHPDKHKAHKHNRYVVKAEACTKCGSTEDLQSHHPDYSRPDYTTTLCRKCHQKLNPLPLSTLTSLSPL